MAKLLILMGLFFIVAGLLWMAGDSLGLGNFLGHLPGDISFTKGNTSFHFPIVTVQSLRLSSISSFACEEDFYV